MRPVSARLCLNRSPSGQNPLTTAQPARSSPGCCLKAVSRRQIAKTLQVSTQNDYALLDRLGGECAGAVTLLEPGQSPQAADAPREVRWLDHAQLLQVLDEMPLRPMLVGDDGLRLSLAGAQDKLPVVLDVDGMRIGLPLNGSPSPTSSSRPLPGWMAASSTKAFAWHWLGR